MELCAYSGEHFIPNLHFRRRTTPIVKASSLLSLLDHSHRLRCLSASSVKCNKKKYDPFILCSDNNSSSSSSSAPNKKSKNLVQLPFIIKTFFGFSSAAATALIIYNISNSSDNGGGNGGGWNRGGGGGSTGGKGKGNGGGFWSRIFFSPSAAIDKEEDQEKESSQKNQEWVFDHGLIPSKIKIWIDQVFKRLMIMSTGLKGLIKVTKINIHLFDPSRKNTTNVVAGNRRISTSRLVEMFMVRSGQIYMPNQVWNQLVEGLRNSEVLIWLHDENNPNWRSPESFRCINVGLMPNCEPFELEPETLTGYWEKMEYFKSITKAYQMRIDKARRSCLMPLPVQNEILMKLKEGGKEVNSRITRLHLFKTMRDQVQKWYHDNGYCCAQVVYLGGSAGKVKEIVCEVAEGDITQLDIQFKDKLDNVCQGNTQLALIKRQLPNALQQGHVYNHEAAKKAFRNLKLLGLFSNVQIIPRGDGKNVGGVLVEINLKELPRNKSETQISWNINPGFDLHSLIQPYGNVKLVYGNIKGLNRRITGEIASPNFFNPQDLEFKYEYIHPYLDGVNDPRNRTFRTSCFNTHKRSPVYTGEPRGGCVPPIWVDRAGIKTNITENYNDHNKFIYGLVMEKITTRDVEGNITNGLFPFIDVANHDIIWHGAQTTLNEMGTDYMVFAQANITRDNTRFVNGTTVGQRTVFQVDQGLGIGTQFPFFNRHQLTHTRFLQLKQVEESAGKPPPPVLVLHGHYGGCVGDLPCYDAFTIGGPYSVRGYNMGDLGACRYILEVAAELRIPVKNTHVYAFVEHGNDLGSSKDVRGNPTEFYDRVGQGSSYGLGVKLLDQVRAEFAIKHHEGTGDVFIRFGERF